MPLPALSNAREIRWILPCFVACGHGSPVTEPPPSATTPPAADIVITVEPDGTGVAEGLLAAIRGARQAVHVEMYLLTNPTYLSALEQLAGSGVDVKVVLNESFPEGTSSDDTNEESYAELAQAGVSVRWAPTTTGFPSYTHDKVVVIDPGAAGGSVWVMTMNLDEAGPRDNREFLALDRSPADVAEAENILEADYDGVSITPIGSLIVAPSPENDAANALTALIESARTSLYLEAEELDGAGIEATLLDALVDKARNGVMVRIVLEDSDDDSQTAAVAALQDAGAEVVGYAYGSGMLDIHAKALVVDEERAYVGSENFSGGSLGYNREVGVIVDGTTPVRAILSAIATDFEHGSAYQARD